MVAYSLPLVVSIRADCTCPICPNFTSTFTLGSLNARISGVIPRNAIDCTCMRVSSAEVSCQSGSRDKASLTILPPLALIDVKTSLSPKIDPNSGVTTTSFRITSCVAPTLTLESLNCKPDINDTFSAPIETGSPILFDASLSSVGTYPLIGITCSTPTAIARITITPVAIATTLSTSERTLPLRLSALSSRALRPASSASSRRRIRSFSRRLRSASICCCSSCNFFSCAALLRSSVS